MKISFVNGCFDVLHPGHIELLKYARSLGDYLIVAIDSDRKVAELEGLLDSIRPDTLVVGSDWKGKEVVGSQYAKSVKFFDRIGDYSTTKTIQGSPYR